MKKETKTLNARESLAIYVVGERTYPELNAKGKPSKLAGQSYWLCTYEGVTFTTQDADFVRERKAGTVDSTTLQFVEGTNAQGEPVQLIEFRGYQSAVAVDALDDRDVARALRARKLKLIRETAPTPQELQQFSFADATE